MADLDQISAEIGSLRADNKTAKDDRTRLWKRQEETLKAVNEVKVGIEKLCTARNVEQRIAKRNAALFGSGGGIGGGAVMAALFKWMLGH